MSTDSNNIPDHADRINIGPAQVDDNSSNTSEGREPGGVVEILNKTPNSYKYPLLKRYYEFGPWVGRNRKATCLGCRLQTSSSQPDRLLKHLNKCSALSEPDKVVVQDLMNERTANKRKKTLQPRIRHPNVSEIGTAEYYSSENHDHDRSMSDSLALSSLNTSQNCLPAGTHERHRREHNANRTSQIDEALTRFIMMCRIPLKAIHSQEFIEFCRALNPEYHIPSKETITNVLIPGLLNII